VRRVEGYLSRLAQQIWTGALVFGEGPQDGGGPFILERPGKEPIGLGETFSNAHHGLSALIRAEKK
jgi:hypothetical protein